MCFPVFSLKRVLIANHRSLCHFSAILWSSALSFEVSPSWPVSLPTFPENVSCFSGRMAQTNIGSLTSPPVTKGSAKETRLSGFIFSFSSPSLACFGRVPGRVPRRKSQRLCGSSIGRPSAVAIRFQGVLNFRSLMRSLSSRAVHGLLSPVALWN